MSRLGSAGGAHRSAWGLAALLLGCEQDPRGPFDLDSIDEPEDKCVVVIHEQLELGVALHDYVADGPGSAGGWGLATIVNEQDQHELAVIRVPASDDEPATAPVELGLTSRANVRFELRAGASPGELWLLQEAGSSTTLRRLVPGEGVIAGNGSLANFPATVGSGDCPETFFRQLVLIEGRPFVLALPDCSGDPTLSLQLLELDLETLEFVGTWLLNFDPCAFAPNPTSCQLNLDYAIDPLGPGEATHVADAERVAVGFSQVRRYIDGTSETGVSLLDLRLRASGPVARLVTFTEVWIGPTQLGPVLLGQDPFSIQLHARNDGAEGNAALLRFDTIGEHYLEVSGSVLLPFEGRGRLVQLDNQSVILHVDGGVLRAVPLIDGESWPFWTMWTLVTDPSLVGFEPAGIGHLLLRRSDAPPQLLWLRCLG